MNKPEFLGSSDGNHFEFLDGEEERYRAYFKRFGAGEAVTLIVKPTEERSTDPIRKYYRSVIVPIFAEYMGEPDEDEVHDALAFRFLRIDDCPITGAPRRKSTKRGRMPHDEMCDYVSRLTAWGTVSHGLRFPEAQKDPAKREPRRKVAA